jgi:hypothetical protein
MGVHREASSNTETDTVSAMYLSPNTKSYLTNVLLFARRCKKFGFWPCSFAEFSMIRKVYCICYSIASSPDQLKPVTSSVDASGLLQS